ncbi:MAG: DsbA family protein [bacterium]|nr:DsbA family protein [bacterium]
MDTQETGSQESKKQSSNIAIPASIVIAGALIAFAVFSRPTAPNDGVVNPPPAPDGGVVAGINLKPVDGSDHVRGNPDAKIKIVEYSDFSCPFCQRFHETMTQVLDEYGQSGDVAWVYRHFPLESIHPNARRQAIASECVNKISGNDKFWEFTDGVFAGDAQSDAAMLQIVNRIGVDVGAFQTCLDSGEYEQLITDSIQEATEAGARGTPYSLVVSVDGGDPQPINGALPFVSVQQIVEAILNS